MPSRFLVRTLCAASLAFLAACDGDNPGQAGATRPGLDVGTGGSTAGTGTGTTGTGTSGTGTSSGSGSTGTMGTGSGANSGVNPGGIYNVVVHSDTRARDTSATALVSEAGVLQLIDRDNGYQYSGQLTTSGTSASSTLRVYDSAGAPLTTGTFSGMVTPRGTITGTYTTANGDRGSLTATYAKAAYETPITLAGISGSYSASNASNTETVARLTFQNDGSFTGAFEAGCTFTGTATLPDARYNLLAVSMTRASSTACGALAGSTLTGLATYVPGSSTQNTTLDFAFAGTNAGYYASYDQRSRNTSMTAGGNYGIGYLEIPSQNTTHSLQGNATEDNALQFQDFDNQHQYSGRLVLNGTAATASFRVYDNAGKYVSTASFSGKVQPHENIIGTLTQANGERQTLTLIYSRSYEDPNPTVAAIAGRYAYTSNRNGGQTTLTVNSNGSLSGTTEFGCPFTGTVSVPDARYNLFSVSLQIANNTACGASASSTLTGTAEYAAAVSSPPLLFLIVSNANAGYFSYYTQR